MIVNKVSSFKSMIFSFICGLLFLLGVILFSKIDVIRFSCVLFSVVMFIQSFYFSSVADIFPDGDEYIHFRKVFSDYRYDIALMTIQRINIPSRGAVFLLDTDTDTDAFRINYTQSNYAGLKHLIVQCKSSAISVNDFEKIIKNSWKSLKGS